MINEERVRLMTRMASYEKRDGKKHLGAVSYFRSDYISLQILKTVIATTIAFGILFGLFVLYDFELFMHEIYKMDLLQFGKSVILLYLIMQGVFILITYVVYLYRYNQALRSLKRYHENLKKLYRSYDGKEEAPEPAGGRKDS
ncbi:MAG: hypothetical protein IJC59_03185 [Lachnospiraceae bacterium]|nr:hypothetical protein [Lachnospiraceae bacterium]